MTRQAVLLTIVLVYAAAFRLVELNRPFEYDAEGSGCLNGVLARSYLRFGWRQSHGMPILSLDPAHATPVVFYPDHPPLVPLLIVPFYAVFSVGAWQTRVPMSLLTIATIIILYRMLARAASTELAVIAAAVFAATPMMLYFGGFPDVVGIPLVFFVVLTISQYMRFHDAPAVPTFARFVCAFALAGICDWPAYVLVPILIIHFVVTRTRRDWPWIVAFGVAASALFVVLYAYITVATNSPWTWIVPLFHRRSALVGGDQHSWSEWARAALSTNVRYQSLPVLVASGLWIVLGSRHNGRNGAATIARLLLAWAAAYAVVGSKALYDHEWAWMPFTPGLAVATAIVLDSIVSVAGRVGLDRPARWTTAMLLALFAALTWQSVAVALHPTNRSDPYDPIELGEAIQAAAPDRSDVALLVGGEEAEGQLWFYGDRAVRTKVWSIDDFERRLHDRTVDLLYYFDEQPWPGRATGVVFPRDADEDYAALHAFLIQHYPQTTLRADLEAKFEVFDIRSSADHRPNRFLSTRVQ